MSEAETPLRPVSDQAHDDMVLPFAVEPLDVRGRVVRLGPAIDEILTRHAYPPPVARLVGEAAALTVLLGAALKSEGRLQLQTRSDGIVETRLQCGGNRELHHHAGSRIHGRRPQSAGRHRLPPSPSRGKLRAIDQNPGPENPVTALNDAVTFYQKHHPAGAQRIALKELTQRFVESRKRRGLSTAYISSVEIAMNTFLKAFPNTGCELPTGNGIIHWLGKKFTSPVTRNTNLRTLKTMAVWAKKQSLVSHETISGVELWKEPAGEIEIYAPAEMERLLKGIPAMMIPQIAIGAFAGLRVAEARRLDWSEINLERGFITVAASKAKTAARRLVPIQENLKAWLKPYAKESGNIAPYARGYLNEMVRLKNLPNKRNALRHSYISYRLALTPDAPRVALECGNSPR